MKKKILIGLLVIFVLIQFIRPEKNQGVAATPQDITHFVQVPDTIMHILQASCYDCHSNKTNYPWYTNINPIGLWLNHHVEEGKAELNFSDFAQYDKKKLDHKLEETAEEVGEGHMPISEYLWMHQDAELDEGQKKLIADWVKQERQRLAQQP